MLRMEARIGRNEMRYECAALQIAAVGARAVEGVEVMERCASRSDDDIHELQLRAVWSRAPDGFEPVVRRMELAAVLG